MWIASRSLRDNAAVYGGRSRRGKVALELELERHGIEVEHSTPRSGGTAIAQRPGS